MDLTKPIRWKSVKLFDGVRQLPFHGEAVFVFRDQTSFALAISKTEHAVSAMTLPL